MLYFLVFYLSILTQTHMVGCWDGLDGALSALFLLLFNKIFAYYNKDNEKYCIIY